MIGGDRDADGNVVLGVRAGIEVSGSSNVTIRGNFSYHRYPFGWSQGMNLAFDAMPRRRWSSTTCSAGPRG